MAAPYSDTTRATIASPPATMTRSNARHTTSKRALGPKPTHTGVERHTDHAEGIGSDLGPGALPTRRLHRAPARKTSKPEDPTWESTILRSRVVALGASFCHR